MSNPSFSLLLNPISILGRLRALNSLLNVERRL